MNDEKLELLVEVISDLQYLVQDMAIDYFCFDHRVVLFYMMDPYQVLMKITENIEKVESEGMSGLIEQLKDFITYYEINDDDIDLLYENLVRLCEGLDRVPPTLSSLLPTPR